VIGDDLDIAFQARHLAVPMSIAVTVDARMTAGSARRMLEDHRFDQAPVVDDGQIVGFVLTRHLEGRRRVVSTMTRVGQGSVVSANASIGRLLEWIIDPGFLFVLEGRDITGFVTVYDFNKQAARGYLYLLLARLETGLADLIRRYYDGDARPALGLLSNTGRMSVESRYRDDVAAQEEGDLLSYFDLSDLVRVVHEEEDLRRMATGWSRSTWSRMTGGLVRLRNDVMHPVRNVVLAREGIRKLHEREQRLRLVLDRIEAASAKVAV